MSLEMSFDNWRFDYDRGVLSDGDVSHDLEPEVANLLKYLLDNQRTLISREQLVRDVWAAAATPDDAIDRCVARLRTLLSPDDQDKYIQIVPDKGFISDMGDVRRPRRLCTVMAADVAGYTRLMEADEERTIAAVRACRQIFQRHVRAHGGRIFNTAGDSILAEFPSVLDVIQAAIAIQIEIADHEAATPPKTRIAYRMGVHIGDVLEDDHGDLFGECVNIAARLEQAGTPGEITISEVVRNDIQTKVTVTVRAIGKIRLKNVQDPMPLYSIVSGEPQTVWRVAFRQWISPARNFAAVVLAVLVVVVLWMTLDRLQTDIPEKSIAILPFANLSTDNEGEYFADGIAEDLLNALARIPDLKVVGQSSSFKFRDDRDIAEMGRRLNVATVLDGSVRQSSGRLRLTARLVNTSSGYQIWSESFDRDVQDIFAIQDEISLAIVDALKIHLAGGVESRLPVSAAANIEAYNYYLLGRHHFKKRSVAELEQARDLFRRAITSDRNYAPAYAGLADSLLLLSDYAFGSVPLEDTIAQALPLLPRAFQIDPDLADLHASLGFLRRMQQDFLAAEASLTRAIELSPNMARAHNWLYITYDGATRHRQALEALKRAFELDPLSPIISANLAAEYWSRGENEEALTAANRVIEILPDNPAGHLRAGRILWTRGDLADALTWYRKAGLLSPNEPATRREMGYLLLNLGDYDRAEELLSDYIYFFQLAVGNREAAVRAADSRLKLRPDTTAFIVAAARSKAWVGDFQASRELLEPLAGESTRLQGPLFERANLLYWDPAIPAMDLALARMKTGDVEGARQLTDRIRSYFHHLREEGLDHPGITYQEARLLSLEGRTGDALASLRRAIDMGWRSWYTQGDPILELLREEPEFTLLIEEIRRLVALEKEKIRILAR